MNDDLIEVVEVEKELEVELASRWARIVAFGLDLLLVIAITLLVLGFFVFPHYPGALQEFGGLAHVEGKTQKELIEKMSPALKDMIQVGHTVAILIFWVYFGGSEILMRGGSLGKAVFSIRVVNDVTLKAPGVFDSIMRAGIKTFSLLAWTPILMINFFLFFFTKKGQAGHDFLSRTVVIQGNTNTEKEIDEEDEWE